MYVYITYMYIYDYICMHTMFSPICPALLHNTRVNLSSIFYAMLLPLYHHLCTLVLLLSKTRVA